MSTNEIDIVKLSINDTFYDWFLRTNQVIDYVNPINVYDVFAGAGILESRTGTPGTIELSISTKPETYAVDTVIDSGVSTVVMNYNLLTTGTVSATSRFGIQQSSGSQIYKVLAPDILPPTINGNHQFLGTITVADLIVNDGTITLNNTNSTRDNCGLMVESTADTNSENVFFTYDTTTEAWYSSENLGVKSGKAFVTDSSPKAIFPFQASSSQGQIDVRLQSIIGGVNERFSIEAEFDASNSLTFSHYLNNVLVHDVLELTSNGTAGSEVIVKDIITITDVINSNPFSQTPVATNIPITDSTNGYLNTFVNRTKLPKGSVTVGKVVRMGIATLELATPTSLSASQSIGIVESLDGANAVVITSGPFSGISGLSGLNTGAVYYLDPTVAGGVTDTDPNNTNGILDKPIFIATSATGGVLIPDFTSIGGGTVISGTGTGTVNNAFKTISVDTETLTASGEDNVIFSSGTFIDLDLSGDVITANCTIANGRTGYSIWSTDASGTLSFNTIPTYSIPARTLEGTLSSVTFAPGTLLGRKDDTDDTNNPVEALSGGEVLSLLGFSGNKYIRNILFEGGTGTDEFDFDAENNESIRIRAGDNISFEYEGNYLYIHSAGLADNTNLGGSSGALIIATEGDPPSQITRLIFEDDFGGAHTSLDKFIEFSMRTVGTNSDAYISAKPTNNYLKLSAGGATTSFHTAGGTLKVQGNSGSGTTSVLSGETFTIGLASTIIVDKIKPTLSTANTGLILSGEDATGRNTIQIVDSERKIAANNLTDEYTIVINAFDSTSSATIRQSTFENGGISESALRAKCVSMYADTTFTSDTGNAIYSYPFKFFEIIVDKLHVGTLTADFATKTVEYLNTVIGNATISNPLANYSYVNISNDMTNIDGNPRGENGVALLFTDDQHINNNISYFIARPSVAKAAALSIPTGTITLSDYLSFSNSGNANLVSPCMSRESATAILISSLNNATVGFKMTGNDIGSGDFGFLSGSDGYSFINATSGNTSNGTAYLRLDANTGNSIIKTNTLTITDGTYGIKFDTPEFADTATDNGKVMFVDSVASGVATMKTGFIVKSYNSGSGVISTDPINTLYYTL